MNILTKIIINAGSFNYSTHSLKKDEFNSVRKLFDGVINIFDMEAIKMINVMK